MNRFVFGRSAAIAAIIAGALTVPAFAQPGPDGDMTFHGGSLAFIGGFDWGSGKLSFRGHQYGLKVHERSIDDIGATSYDAIGQVYNLRNSSDIEGLYTPVAASEAAAAGAGEVLMKNDKGVEILAHSTSTDSKPSFGGSGLYIRLDH